jgi:hypothetical protein
MQLTSLDLGLSCAYSSLVGYCCATMFDEPGLRIPFHSMELPTSCHELEFVGQERSTHAHSIDMSAATIPH